MCRSPTDFFANKYWKCTICNALYCGLCLTFRKKMACSCPKINTKTIIPSPESIIWRGWKSLLIQSNMGLKSLAKEEFMVYENEIKEVIESIYKKKYSRSARPNQLVGLGAKAIHDPLVSRGNLSILKAYHDYLNPLKAPPLMIKYINATKGYGIFSIQKIPRLTLICEYAADIVPINYPVKNDKTMYFGWGLTSDTETQLTT